MKTCYPSLLVSLGVGLLCTVAPGFAQGTKAPLAVASIKPLPSLTGTMTASGNAGSLARVVEAFDGQLIDRLSTSRKFQLVGRSDLGEFIREQELAGSGNVNETNPNAAQPGQLAGARYLLVATIDDFDDATEKMAFPSLNQAAIRRQIRLATTAKIYDSSTGKLMESVHVQLNRMEDRLDRPDLQRNSDPSDALLLTITRAAAEQIATRIADLVFPVRVLVKRDLQITINRGEGAGVELGQLFNVFAQGQELVDPDTGERLGREEVLLGKARVISVQPKFSTAEIVEDLGIDVGAVLRPAGPQ